MSINVKDRYNCVQILALLLVLLAIQCPALLAQSGSSTGSTLLFPRFISNSDLSSEISIFNPSDDIASVTFTLKSVNGTFLTNAIVKIVPRGQITKTAGDLFPGLAAVDGSLLITSSTSGLVPLILSYNSQMSNIDGTSAAESSGELLFPIVPKTGEGTSEISIHNPNVRSTAVALSLWDTEGHLLETAKVKIPAGGLYHNDPAKIFAKKNLSVASHITATSQPINVFMSAQSIAGTISFSGFFSVGTLDSGMMAAQPLSTLTNTGVIPYFRTGSPYASTLCLTNVEPSAIDITLTAVGNDGATLDTKTLSVPAMGGLRSSVESIFPNVGTDSREGWVLVQATGRVHATVLFGRNDGGAFSAVPIQQLPKVNAIFPRVLEGSGNSMEISMVNTGTSPSDVTVYRIDSDGSTLASNHMEISPGARVSKSLNALLPEVSSQTGGFVYLAASSPIFSTAADWIAQETSVVNLIPQALTVPYQPSKLTSFAVTGFVTLNGISLQGMRIVLSGPVGKLTTTDADGSYAFSDVPAGYYSLAIGEAGFESIFPMINFEITTGSVRQDFQGYTDPDVIVVLPLSLPIGTSDKVVDIFGQGFESTATAFADATKLSTTYVDSSHLKVTIPSFLLTTPASFAITVKNGSAASQAFNISVYQDKPTLTGVITPGNLVEGNEGTTLTLQGTGFLPGMTVLINGSSDGIIVNVVDSTNALAYVPSSYLESGGIIPVVIQNSFPANAVSNIQLLTVYHPSPEIDEVIPGKVQVKLDPGSGHTGIEIHGFNFRRGAVALLNGTPLSTLYCEDDDYCLATVLYASIPADLLRNSGFGKITVRNPSPVMADSSVWFLEIEGLQPTITGVIPGTTSIVNSSGSFKMPVVVNGTNFGPQTLVAVYQQSDDVTTVTFAAPEEVLSSTQLYTTIDVNYPSALGLWNVQVMNPPPVGGLSNITQFSIGEENFDSKPFLIALDPSIVTAGGPGFTMTITGANFKNGAQAQINSTLLSTTVLSPSQLAVQVPARVIATAGRFPVTVINQDTGGASNRLFLEAH
jgi:hypothetical protein